MSNGIIFSTQIMSILAYLGILFYLYRTLAAQKDSTIETLNTIIKAQDRKLAAAEKEQPDVVLAALHARVSTTAAELDKQMKDKKHSQEEINQKELELNKLSNEVVKLRSSIEQKEADLVYVKTEVEELSTEISDRIAEFLCPDCGAPMTTREYYSVLVECDGREIDIDHELTSYACGYTLCDGSEESPCGQM